jgi:hypothetical protein
MLLLTMAALFMHGLGYVFVVAMCLGTLLVSLQRWRHIWQVLLLVPSVVVWRGWFEQKLSESAFPGSSLTEMLAGAYYFSSQELADWFVRESLDVLDAPSDNAYLWFFTLIWLLLMGLSAVTRSKAGGSAEPTSPENQDTQPERFWRRRKRDLAGLYAWARDHVVLLMALALGLAYMLLPGGLDQTTVNQRVIFPWIVALVMLPRLPPRSLLAHLGIAATIVGCLMFGGLLQRSMESFARRETAVIQQLLAHIPQGARVDCIADEEDVLIRHGLLNNCPGLIVAHTRGFSGTIFAATGYNAVHVLPGNAVPQRLAGVPDWQLSPFLHAWDYVLVRGEHRAPSLLVARLVEAVPPAEPDASEWRLYRVLHGGDGQERLELSLKEQTGPAQQPLRGMDCPRGSAIAGLELAIAATSGDDAVGSLTPLCRGLSIEEQTLVSRGPVSPLDTFGLSSCPMTPLSCPDGHVAVGLYGASSAVVDRAGLLCAPIQLPSGDLGVAQRSGLRRAGTLGGESGEPYELLCPDDSVLLGVEARSDGVITALGVRCARVRTVMEREVPR